MTPEAHIRRAIDVMPQDRLMRQVSLWVKDRRAAIDRGDVTRVVLLDTALRYGTDKLRDLAAEATL